MRLNTRRLATPFALFALTGLLLLAGCATTPKAATPAGAHGKWKGGYLTRVYKTDFQTAYNAAQECIISQGGAIGSTRNDPKKGLVVGSTNSPAVKFIFRIQTFDNGLTEVSLKVHPGDEAKTASQMDSFGKLLPASAAG